MLNYNDIAKRFMMCHREKTLAEKQISAITTALIGAVGEGYKVKTLNYNKEDMMALDLKVQKEIFRESGKTVDELETSLINIIETKKLSELYLGNEMELLKIHYSMRPNAFLSKFIFIPNHVVTKLGEEFQVRISEILTKRIDNGDLYSMMTNPDGVMIFAQRCNDMKEIKDYISLDDNVQKYTLQDLVIDEDTQYFLGYLYIQQHEGKQ